MLANYHRTLGIVLIVSALAAATLFISGTRAADEPTLPSAKSLDGIWQGALKLSGIELRIVVHIGKDKDGKLQATMDSPDQSAKGILVDTAMLDGDDVQIEVKRIQGTFTGKLGEDGQKITGTWKQAGTELPLVLERTDKELVLNRPQEPKPPYPYAEEAVTYANAAAGVKLAGTLTLPKSDRPVAAVLLISGSGRKTAMKRC